MLKVKEKGYGRQPPVNRVPAMQNGIDARKKMLRLVRVLFASPGDATAERAVIPQVVEELNRIWGERTGVWLRPLMWETETYPATSEDGQAVINEQFGDDYEVFVGIMRERFGSPTLRETSGTKEEYERAYTRHRLDPHSIDIAFYFSSAPLSRERLNAEGLEQLQRLLAFREEVRRRGTLDRSYANLDEFETQLRLHLSRLMQKWQDRWATLTPAGPTPVETDLGRSTQGRIETPPILLTEETLTQDMHAARAQLDQAYEVRGQVTRAIARFGEQTRARTDALNHAVATGDQELVGRVLSDLSSREAHDLAEAGDAIGPLVIPFAQYYRAALLTLSRVAVYTAATRSHLDGVTNLVEVLESFRPVFDEVRAAIEGLRASLDAGPASTIEVFRNRQHCLYAVDALLSESRNISSLMSEVASALRDAVEQKPQGGPSSE